jgi:hypothetical protein
MYRPKTRRFTGEAAVIGFVGILVAFLCSLTSEPLFPGINVVIGIGVVVSGVNAIYEMWRLAKKQEEELRSTQDQDY